MDSNDKRQKQDNVDSNSSRKKFLNRVAVATALVGVTGIAGHQIGTAKKASAMMKIPNKVTSTIKTPTFTGSNGFKRPVNSGLNSFKPTTSVNKIPSVNKPTTSVTKPVTSTTKPGSSNTVVKPGGTTNTGVKPGNVGSLVNKFESMNKPNTGTGSIKAPTKPTTGNTVTAPNKPNTGSSVTAPTKPNTGTTNTTQKPSTGNSTGSSTGNSIGVKPGNTGDLVNKFESMNKPNTGSGSLKAPTKPNTGTTNTTQKPNTGTNTTQKPSTGNSTGSSTGSGVKPGNVGNLVNKFEGGSNGTSNKKPSTGSSSSQLKPNASSSTGTSNNKPSSGSSSSQLKPNSNTSNGSSQNKPNGSTSSGLKPNTNSGSNSQKQPVVTQTGSGNKGSGSTTGNKGQGNGTQNGSLKPSGNKGQGSGTSGSNSGGSIKSKSPSTKSSSLKTNTDADVNTKRVGNSNVQQGGSGGKTNKLMTAVGLVTTVAFLGTAIAGIIQGQQSMDMQVKLQQDAIKAQEELAKKQQTEEYEKLAAQLGGKYDPDAGVIILPDGSKLNVITGIVTHPDGSWTDQNGNLHLPDGSGVIKPDGSIDIDGIGTIDKDGNLVLEDGSGYFDKDGNFIPSGSISQVVGMATGVGYGGMYTDTKFGGKSVVAQSENYGYKAYSRDEYDRAQEKAASHKSVTDGVFTAREYDAIVNLIISAKLNKSMVEKMGQDGTFTSAQIEVINQLLDTFNSSGKI